MNVDEITEGAWTSVIQGTGNVQFEFLALQLFLANLRNQLRAKEISTQDCIRELKTFYRKFCRLPAAENDFNKIASREEPLANRLLGPEEVARRITAGQSLMLAGEEQLLAALPPGNWIGGTTPYFMGQDGGCLCKDKIFVTEISGQYQASIRSYAASELPDLYRDTTTGAVSFVILPAESPVHTEFALHAPHYAGFALHPLVGWIAGIDLAMLGQATPKVFCGGPRPFRDAAAVMHIKLPADRLAQIKIINLFRPGDGDSIFFPVTGFSATTATISGHEHNLARYLQRIQADTRLPLVANYSGTMVNVSLKNLDPQSGRVEFYAPVVSGIEYKLAAPVKDYLSELAAGLRGVSPANVLFSCNCVHNHLHFKLDGQRTGDLVGPVAFGEIAFQLLNRTLVYIEVIKVASPEPHRGEAPSIATTLELSAAHEELRASERRFRILSESAPMGIFLTDTDGRIIYTNPRCQSLIGVSAAESLSDSWLRNIHPSDLSGLTAAIQASEREGRDLDHEFRFLGPEGKARWVHSRTIVLRSETGAPSGRIGILQDITERKQSELQLERLNQDLVRASREAGIAEFATGVLHNVKNVINSINVSAAFLSQQVQRSKSSSLARVTDLLREHAGDLGSFMTEDPKGKLLPEFLDKLAKQLDAEHAAILGELRQFEKNVNHIKDIVTAQQNQAKLGSASEKIKPVELMEDALRLVGASLVRHGIQVARDYDPTLPEICVEKHKVLQILVNFLRNAKHACQTSDRAEKKLILSAVNDGGFVRLAVTDNGIGILPEHRKHLFQHGFTTKKEGHGFGLHSAALAARDLGGDIQAHSDGLGTGATFALRVPLRQG